MNRTERLYALVDVLRARAPRPVRAAELAGRFEVSIRTIERDLLALQEAGVPIWAQPGPGGGYGLNVETTLPPLNLTAAEAAAIATALAVAQATPFGSAGTSALSKVAAVMALGSREGAQELVSRVRLRPGPRIPTGHVADNLQQALRTSSAVELGYRDRQGRETVRVVEPAGFLGTDGGWYLVAWCRLRQAPRTFRLDRIARVTLNHERIGLRSLDALLRDLPYDTDAPALP